MPQPELTSLPAVPTLLRELELARGSRALVLAASHLDLELLPAIYEQCRQIGQVARLDVVLHGRGDALLSSAADCTCGMATKLPALRRRSISPARARLVSALPTVARAQPYWATNSCSKGMRSPGRHSPERMRPSTSARMRSSSVMPEARRWSWHSGRGWPCGHGAARR